MILSDIIYMVALLQVAGKTDIEISDICFDSRKAQSGGLFVAVKGTQTDGHDYIDEVIEKGVVCIVHEDRFIDRKKGVVYILVKDSAKALSVIASNFYGNPSSKLELVGVTGTNGKTTTVTLLYQLFKNLGYTVGMLSTVENRIDDEVVPATHTTPDAIGINQLLVQMLKKGCTHCFMEVSSHSVVQQRVYGLQFKGGVFTNISHDHLDYHGTFNDYITAKKGFFDNLSRSAFALINADDKRGEVMLQNTKARKNAFSFKSITDFRAKILTNSMQGLEMEIDQKPVWFKLTGEFNAYNLLGVYATAILLGEPAEEVLTQMSLLDAARGRFEILISANKVIGLVDYAHTPDALENVLKTVQSLKEGGTVITVIGCGGNRDKLKRPKMAEIACALSDKVILTSDNPRNEDPKEILEDMKAGVSIPNSRKTTVIEDRREAIKLACSFAKPHDIILLAGKGHETYQEINGVKHHFDDKEELENMFNLLGI